MSLFYNVRADFGHLYATRRSVRERNSKFQPEIRVRATTTPIFKGCQIQLNQKSSLSVGHTHLRRHRCRIAAPRKTTNRVPRAFLKKTGWSDFSQHTHTHILTHHSQGQYIHIPKPCAYMLNGINFIQCTRL